MEFTVQPFFEQRAYVVQAETTIQIGGETVRAKFFRGGFASEEAAKAGAETLNVAIDATNLATAAEPFVLAEMEPKSARDLLPTEELFFETTTTGPVYLPVSVVRRALWEHDQRTEANAPPEFVSGGLEGMLLIPAAVVEQVTKALNAVLERGLPAEWGPVLENALWALNDAAYENEGGMDVP